MKKIVILTGATGGLGKEFVKQIVNEDIDDDFNKVLDDVEKKSNEADIDIPKSDEEDIWKF